MKKIRITDQVLKEWGFHYSEMILNNPSGGMWSITIRTGKIGKYYTNIWVIYKNDNEKDWYYFNIDDKNFAGDGYGSKPNTKIGKLKYVHELQEAYFKLTGKKLKQTL